MVSSEITTRTNENVPKTITTSAFIIPQQKIPKNKGDNNEGKVIKG